MGSVLRNIIIILLLFVVAFWIYTVMGSCNKPERDVVTMEEAASKGGADQGEDSQEANLEDLYEVEESDVDAGDVDGSTPTPAEANDDLEVGEANAPDEDVRAEESTPRSGSTFGRYLVVTGSYLSKANAKLMSGQLQRKGYDAAEVFVFDLSQYYSVTAGRYATLSEARTVARNLKTEGVEAYVHKMRGKRVSVD